MTARPLISVVIPTYNRAKELPTAIKSVQAQTYPHWEMIISDDGSKDNTQQVIEQFISQDKRIRYLRQEKNAGAQAARNAGIKAAQGEWIAFLDSDDQWLTDSLERRLRVAERDNVAVVHSNAYIIQANHKKELQKVPPLSGWVHKAVLSGEGPMFPCLLVRKSALEQIGYLDETIVSYQEWDTAIRLAKIFPFGFEPEPTFIYDYRTENAISRDSVRAGRGYEQIVRKHRTDILTNAGIEAWWYHRWIAGQWYKKGGDHVNYWRCRIQNIIGKCCHLKSMFPKLKPSVVKSQEKST
jgi:glycosyltransferase involved in cell wall biosynthesis